MSVIMLRARTGGGNARPGSPLYEWVGDMGVTGNPVTLWASQVNSNDATPGNSPIVAPSWSNGKDAIDFASSDQLELATAMAWSAEFMLVAALERRTADIGSLPILGHTSAAEGIWVDNAGGDAGEVNIKLGGSTTVIAAAGTVAADDKGVLIVTRDAGDNIIVWWKGSDVTNGTPNVPGTLDLNSIGRISGLGNANGIMGHVLPYSVTLPAKQAAHDYVAAYWDLT